MTHLTITNADALARLTDMAANATDAVEREALMRAALVLKHGLASRRQRRAKERARRAVVAHTKDFRRVTGGPWRCVFGLSDPLFAAPSRAFLERRTK